MVAQSCPEAPTAFGTEVRGSIFEQPAFISVKNNSHARITCFADRQERVTDLAAWKDMVVETCIGKRELKRIGCNRPVAASIVIC